LFHYRGQIHVHNLCSDLYTALTIGANEKLRSCGEGSTYRGMDDRRTSIPASYLSNAHLLTGHGQTGEFGNFRPFMSRYALFLIATGATIPARQNPLDHKRNFILALLQVSLQVGQPVSSQSILPVP